MSNNHDPHRRAKNTLPATDPTGTDWQRHVLATLLDTDTPEDLTDEQVNDPQMWLLAYANLCASRGHATPSALYTELATDVQSQAEMQAFMRDTLIRGLIRDVQELRQAVVDSQI